MKNIIPNMKKICKFYEKKKLCRYENKNDLKINKKYKA